MLPAESLVAIKSRFEFSATAEPTGNLTMGRGRAYAGVGKAAVPIHVAIVENKIASGSLGVKECDKLASLFTVVASQKRGLVLYLDSAGARVSEGLAGFLIDHIRDDPLEFGFLHSLSQHVWTKVEFVIAKG